MGMADVTHSVVTELDCSSEAWCGRTLVKKKQRLKKKERIQGVGVRATEAWALDCGQKKE